MVGADLANLANEAALLALAASTRRCRWPTSPTRWRRSCSAPRAASCCRPADRERTAYHESGHALVGMLTAGADPVRKVSIIPRGMALGVTLSTPDSDRVSYSLEELQAKIRVALGGRVAEEVVYGTITTGAESDIQQLTDDRAPDGRPLGHERGDRPDRGAARGGCRDMFLPGVSATSEADPAPRRRGGAQARRKRAPGGHAAAGRAPRAVGEPCPGAACERDARRARRVCGGGLPGQAPSQEEPGDGSRHGRQAAGVDGVSA